MFSFVRNFQKIFSDVRPHSANDPLQRAWTLWTKLHHRRHFEELETSSRI